MVAFILFFFFCAGASDSPAWARYSYSGEYGGRSGDYFDQSRNQLDGPITAMKIRANNRCIVSIQICYGDSWSNIKGSVVGSLSGMELFMGEGFVQVTGRFGDYVEYLAFRTNLGRHFAFGPSTGPGMTFDAEPLYQNTVLRYVSGHSGSLVNALGFHWDEEQWIGTGNRSLFSTHPSNISLT